MNCVPDIFSMMEWSNWLTPFNSKRRYDTVFYLVFLNNKPCATPDLNEISGLIVSYNVIKEIKIKILYFVISS